MGKEYPKGSKEFINKPIDAKDENNREDIVAETFEKHIKNYIKVPKKPEDDGPPPMTGGMTIDIFDPDDKKGPPPPPPTGAMNEYKPKEVKQPPKKEKDFGGMTM